MLTTAISAYYLVKFRKDGVLPYESTKADSHHLGGESQKDNEWSADTHDIDHEFDDDTRTERGGNQEEDEYALLHSTETEEGRHPGRPLSWGEDRFSSDPAPPYAGYDDPHTNTSALSPGGYEEYRREAGRSGQGYEDYRREAASSGQRYSFSGGDR